MPNGLKTVENHNLEEESDTLYFNKLKMTVTKNHKGEINRVSYIKIICM